MNCSITFSGRFHYRKGGGVCLHRHTNDYQIQLVYGGKGTATIDGKSVRLETGDVVFIKRNNTHEFSADSIEGMKTLEAKFVASQADEEILSSIALVFPDQDKQIFSDLQRIVMEGHRKALAYIDMSNAYLVECIVHMARICSARGGGLKERPDIREGRCESSPVMEAVTDFIYKNMNKNFTLAQLAAGCGYNQDYIYRTVRKQAGCSTIQYINKLKFEQAKEWIQHTELSISEIAWNVGFDSRQYFSKFFRLHAGISPSEYLEQTRDTVKTQYI
ncbi:MAG: AraC family transcriptional regulator [Sphaerochaetaceae bacterium]